MEERIKAMLPLLNEYQRRIFLASEAMAYGWGGVQKVSEISGVSMNAIRKGIAEIEGNAKLLQVGAAHPDRNAQFEYINL